MINSILSKLINKVLMGITRKFNKEFSMYSYTIYTIDTWSILVINNPTLKYMCCP